MVWYYAEGNQQRGPLSDAEFDEMIENGRIGRETLVWRDGMENWQSLAIVRPNAGTHAIQSTEDSPLSSSVSADESLEPQLPAAAQTSDSLQQTGYQRTATAPESMVTCHQCGRQAASSDTTRYGSITICQACRPAFVAQVQQAEGIAPREAYGPQAVAAPTVVYGGFWIRAIARSIDHIFITILHVIFLYPMLEPMQSLMEGVTTLEQMVQISPQMEEVSRRVLPYMLLISVAYHALFVAAFSATPGKLMLGLRVIGKEGVRVSVGRAITRAVVPALFLIFDRLVPAGIGTLALMVGYLMVAFDSQKRSLFDRIAGTRVIRRK